jgi:hypothetical protein
VKGKAKQHNSSVSHQKQRLGRRHADIKNKFYPTKVPPLTYPFKITFLSEQSKKYFKKSFTIFGVTFCVSCKVRKIDLPCLFYEMPYWLQICDDFQVS